MDLINFNDDDAITFYLKILKESRNRDIKINNPVGDLIEYLTRRKYSELIFQIKEN